MLFHFFILIKILWSCAFVSSFIVHFELFRFRVSKISDLFEKKPINQNFSYHLNSKQKKKGAPKTKCTPKRFLFIVLKMNCFFCFVDNFHTSFCSSQIFYFFGIKKVDFLFIKTPSTWKEKHRQEELLLFFLF